MANRPNFIPTARSELIVRLTTTTLSPQPISVISLTRISIFLASTTAHLLPRVDGRPPPAPRVDGPPSCCPESHPRSRHRAVDLLRQALRSPRAPPALSRTQQTPMSSRPQVTSYAPGAVLRAATPAAAIAGDGIRSRQGLHPSSHNTSVAHHPAPVPASLPTVTANKVVHLGRGTETVGANRTSRS